MKKLFKKGADFHDRAPVTFAWDPCGNLLATAGRNAVVHVFDRHGKRVHEVTLSREDKVLVLAWDKDGEVLGILQSSTSIVVLFDLRSRAAVEFDSRLEEPSFLKWSPKKPLLAIAGARGNLQLYNKDSRKTVPVWGKHPSRITCGAWSDDGAKLALGSDDCTVTLSDASGDTEWQEETKYAPIEMHFSRQKGGVLSINMSGKSLLLYRLEEAEAPVELAFQTAYGEIREHAWFGERYILLAFSEGYIVVISTQMEEIGEEMHHKRLHSNLFALAYSPALDRAATLGDGGVRILDMAGAQFSELKSEGIFLDTSRNAENLPNTIKWSPDGQILTVSTDAGVVYNFLAKMPCVHAKSGVRVAYLCSLREVAVAQTTKYRAPNNVATFTVEVEIEPTFMALGPTTLAVGMNNRVLFYKCAPGASAMLAEKEYIGAVTSVALNREFAAVLAGKTLSLERIPSADGKEEQSKMFPNGGKDDRDPAITCMALLEHFLVFGTEDGRISLFFLPDWALLRGAELRHTHEIQIVAPNARGTRVLFVDSAHVGWLYNPVNGEVMKLPLFPTNTTALLWDETDKHVFYAFTSTELHAYVYAASCVASQAPIIKLGDVDIRADGVMTITPIAYPIESGHVPLVCHGEGITYQTPNGTLKRFPSPPYSSFDRNLDVDNTQRLRLRFRQCLALHLLREAWDAALELENAVYYAALSRKALQLLDVPFAVRVYRALGDAAMVAALERIEHVEDKNLIAGYVAILDGSYTKAQELFLASSEPVEALHLQCDLRQWESALKLAAQLAPEQTSELTVLLAQQLEFQEQYEDALKVYESASRTDGDGDSGRLTPTHEARVVHGLARCSLRLGDLHRGLRLARGSGDAQLCRECAGILERETSETQLAEAAALYEFAGFKEDAARLYVTSLRDLSRAERIMPDVKLMNLQEQYAAACEQNGRFKEALEAYERAHDVDAVVRLLLGPMNAPQDAFALVRKKHSASGAEMVAKYCKDSGDIHGVIEFLLMANRFREAFDYAREQDKLEVLAAHFGEDMNPRDAAQVAQYYEQKQDFAKAAHFYRLAGLYSRSLTLFLQCGDMEINNAIDVVGRARDDALTHELIDFVTGEKDGVPKDIRYFYTLQMALGNYAQAAETAVAIATQEQEVGNYREAHEIYYNTIRALEDKGHAIPRDLRLGFQLLHSYLLIQKFKEVNDHEGAARNLLRVAHNISRFPKHDVNLLALAAIECSRAGLKRSAYTFATKLQSPEFRSQLETLHPKLARKIGAMYRHPKVEDEKVEDTSPCPITGRNIPMYSLECPTTRDLLPMCIISGRHMERADFCLCPVTNLPALYTKYMAYLRREAESNDSRSEETSARRGPRPQGRGIEGVDPILGKPLQSDQLHKLSSEEVDVYLARFTGKKKPVDEPSVPETI